MNTIHFFYSLLITLMLAISTTQAAVNWQGPVDIFNTQSAQNPRVGIDDEGNSAIIATVSDNLSTYYQKVGRLVEGAVINVNNFVPINTDQNRHNISVNGSGEASVVWIEQNGSSVNFVRSSLFSNGNWSNPVTISDPGNFNVSNTENPSIYLDASIEALAAWISQNETNSNFYIQSNTYASGWQGVVDVSSSPNTFDSLSLAGAPSGKAIAAWVKHPTFVLQAAYFDGSDWRESTVSTDVSNTNPLYTAAAMNASGNAILLWKKESNGALSSIRFINDSFRAEKTIFIPSVNEDVGDFEVAIDQDGTATAIWVVYNTQTSQIFLMSSRLIDKIWSTPVTLDSASINQNILYLNIAVDNQGNAYAVWEKDDSDGNGAVFFANYSVSDSSWGSSVQISTADVSTKQPNFALNCFGDAVVVWTIGSSGDQTIQAVYTDNQLPLPPRNFYGKQVRNVFLFQVDIVNILHWKPSPDPSVTKYFLFRNGDQIADIPATDRLKYEDHNRVRHETDIYELTAVNDEEMQSLPLTLTLP